MRLLWITINAMVDDIDHMWTWLRDHPGSTKADYALANRKSTVKFWCAACEYTEKVLDLGCSGCPLVRAGMQKCDSSNRSPWRRWLEARKEIMLHCNVDPDEDLCNEAKEKSRRACQDILDFNSKVDLEYYREWELQGEDEE